MKNTPIIMSGTRFIKILNHKPFVLSGLTVTLTPFSPASVCNSDKLVSDGSIRALKFLYLIVLETWNNLIEDASSSLASCSSLYVPVISMTLESG